MRIGFDVSQTGMNKAGCGYYADSLVRELVDVDVDDEFVLYPSFGNGAFNASLEADHIVAASDATRRHFLSTFPHYPRERISVVYQASRFRPNSVSRPQPVRLRRLTP